MENKVFQRTQRTSSFAGTLEKAKIGDKKAMETMIEYFKEDILYFVRFINLPREEAKQLLTTELIELILFDHD